MRVQVARVVVTGTETVELPERCPHCGADFSEPDQLAECQLDHGWQECRIDRDNGCFDYGEAVSYQVAQLVLGFECRVCQTVVAGVASAHHGKRCAKCGRTIEDPQLEGPERCERCAD